MCIGIPMKVIEIDEFQALCEGMGKTKHIDISLIGPQVIGTWVLTFLDSAREVLTDQHAAQITDALMALDTVMRGSSDEIDSLFSDLTEGKPELPDHLK